MLKHSRKFKIATVNFLGQGFSLERMGKRLAIALLPQVIKPVALRNGKVMITSSIIK